MARGPAARRPARGGDEIPALRQARPRLILGAASVAGSAGLAAYAGAASAKGGGLLALVGGIATIVLAIALVLRLPALVTPALVLLGVEFAAFFAVRGNAVDTRAPLDGIALLVVAELAFAALELRAGRAEPGLVARRVATLALLALGGLVAGTLALAAGSAPLGGGVGLEAVGVLAAVSLLFALGRLAVRSR